MKVRLHIQTTTVDLAEEDAKEQSFSSSVIGELVEAENEYLLTYKESELFEMGDTETELKRCETFKELFKKELYNAETELKEKGRLYGKLGIFFGLLVGIVLI